MTRSPLVWIAALVLTLVAVGMDSCQRLESIEAISARGVGTPSPVVDDRSPSGYVGGQHRVVLPAIDGYHWILQTERMRAGGGSRIRTVGYDDAPVGREVHWSGVMRWWSAGVVAVYRASTPGLTNALALERVAPWANTLLLVLVLIFATPLVAWRLGAIAAALFALGCVAAFPFYEYFVVGYFDHHGVATMSVVLSVLCLVAGGAGWVRTEPDDSKGKGAADGALGLPTVATARRWFVASALCAATGLWINAATVVPTLLGIGLGVAAGAVRMSDTKPGSWRAEPSLWRIWGLAGGIVATGFYLLEYFPGHLGVRLEVNHPLYAVAWIAGGDLIHRLSARDLPRQRVGLAVDAAVVLLLPVLILVTGERTFRIADPFLYTLHQRFIVEFLPLAGQLRMMSGPVIAGRASALPLLAVPLAALLWAGPGGRGSWAWRGTLVAAAVAALAYEYVVLLSLVDQPVLALAGCALLAAALVWPFLEPSRPVLAPAAAAVAITVAPATLLLVMSLAQVRWVGMSAALWLTVLVAVAARSDRVLPAWTAPRRAVAAGLLALTFVVAPAFFLPLPLDQADPPQEVARDASWWLRRRVGDRPAVVFTSPNATTWMAYFGGFPGIGTLYWENLDGLRAATAIYTAPSADSLRALLAARGVTHVVLYPWDGGLELLRVAREETGGGGSEEPYLAAVTRALREPGLIPLPGWLSPLPYVPPRVQILGHPSAVIFEVVPDPPPELALVRQAQYYQAAGSPAEIEAALRESVRIRPNAPAWAMLAQLESARGGGAAVDEAVAGLRATLADGDPLDPVDRVNAAIALAVARDGAGAVRELDAVLGGADREGLRRLSREQLEIVVQLARQVGLDRTHPDAIAEAEALLR